MVSGTNKDNISSIYNYNGLGVLVGNEIENINSLEPKVNIQTVDTNISKQFTIDYTKFIPSDLMEEYSDGVSMKYAYVGRHKLSAEIKVNRQEEQKGQEKLFYHTDRLGSSIFVSGLDGEVKAVANFDEWGNRSDYDLIKVGDKDIDLVKSYTGHNYDEILGVYYAKARMYNARDKRFLAEDIVKGKMLNPTTLVAYTYVLNNPLGYIDPDGLFPLWTRGFMEDLGGTVTPNKKNILGSEYGLGSITIAYNGIEKTYTKQTKKNKDGYTIKNGKAYIDDSVLRKDFGLEYSKGYGSAPAYMQVGTGHYTPNCYVYALVQGKSNKQLNPGNYWLRKPSVDKIAEYVIDDMEKWGESARIIDSYDSDIFDNERRIAVRVGEPYTDPVTDTVYDYDYHFMMQTSTGSWAEKHGYGGKSINHAVKYTPEDLSWDYGKAIGFYDSDIIYLAITDIEEGI